MHRKRVVTLLALLFTTASGLLAADEGALTYTMGKPFEIRLAAATNLVLSVENDFCSWKPAGKGLAVRFQFTRGLADPTLVSLEVEGRTNVFLRHFFLRLRTLPMPPRRDVIYEGDATFEILPGTTAGTALLRSRNFRDAFVGRSHQDKAFVIPDPHPDAMDLLIIYK